MVFFPAVAAAPPEFQRASQLLRDTEIWHTLSLTVINTIVLAGRLFPSFPPLLTRLGYSALRGIGLFYLHFQTARIVKVAGDALFAATQRCWKALLYITTQVAVEVSGLALTILGSVAAVLLVVDQAPMAWAIFHVMRPWGLIILVVQVALDVIGSLADSHLLEAMAAILQRDGKRELTLDQFVCDGFLGRSRLAAPLVALIRTRIDATTWRECERKALELAQTPRWHVPALLVRRYKLQKLFATAMANVHDHQVQMRANGGLTALGYAAMALTRNFPNSLIEATVNMGMNLLYSSKLIWKKWQEAGHRETLRAL